MMEPRVRVVAFNWNAPSGASLTVRPRPSGWWWFQSLLAIALILAVALTLSYNPLGYLSPLNQIPMLFTSSLDDTNTQPAVTSIGPAVTSIEPAVTPIDVPHLAQLVQSVPTLAATSVAPTIEAIQTKELNATEPNAAVPMSRVGTLGVSGTVTVVPLEPGLRQRTREEVMGSVELALKHKVGEAEGWWSFSLDISPATAQELLNASLVEIRMIIGCDNANRYPSQRASEHDRVLWQVSTADDAAFSASSMRTHLGQILRLDVERSEHDPVRSSFKIFANPLVFQTLCDDPYKITFIAVFRLGNELIRARISLYYHFTL
jgi:hypothetical protein